MFILHKNPAGEVTIVTERNEPREKTVDSSEVTILKRRIQVLEGTVAKVEVPNKLTACKKTIVTNQ